MADLPPHEQSIPELGRQLREGTLSPVALTEHLLARIDKLNPRLHAFRVIMRERALGEAHAAEAALAAGQDLGPLHGIPYAVKDLYDVRGEATMAGCHLLEDNIAEEDCHVVRRMARAGMILLGKTHTVQFAFGGVGINHDHGTPHNPWSPVPHVPGGSSSGTAGAIASDMLPMALGSDTGGSVRIPAALCGIAGLKTTVGRIGRSGVYPLCPTLDSVGPLARTVEDCALAYDALQGPDPRDETTAGVAAEATAHQVNLGVRGLRMAFCETLFFDEVDPEVEAAVRATGQVFESLGAQVSSIEVPEITEAFTWGRRDLFVAAEACTVNGRFLSEHFDELDPVVAHRMRPGFGLSAADYFALLRRWSELRRQVLETLRDVEVLIVPCTQVASRPVEVVDTGKEVYSQYNLKYLRNSSVGNLLNFCATSVPCGFDSTGMPIGVMLYGKPFAEALVLRAAQAYAQAPDFAARRPDLGWLE